ncbi:MULTISPECIES: hypothetical protein [Nocardia]|uniref:hypothetical protein n=1 Tax=Nocardia TaxID=1817 RepID=UPI0013591EF0|nr:MULTISPECIES: hypothetical protein [Nocardia]
MSASEPAVFFYLLHPAQVKPGDVVYEINDRPLSGGALIIHETRPLPTDSTSAGRGGWELMPEHGGPRRVDADARLKVGRDNTVKRVNPVVAAAASQVRKRRRSTDLHAPCRGQMTLFDPSTLEANR